MENFIILKNNNGQRPYVCFMNTVEDLEYYLEDIKNVMTKRGCTKILIDLFLSNGYSYNRFFEYNLSSEQDLSLMNPRNVDVETYKTINNYLKNNLDLLNNSALSLTLQNVILNQLKVAKT